MSPKPHGNHGLGFFAFEGLEMAFLIDTQHHGLIGRIEDKKPDHVAQLLDEEGMDRELERLQLQIGSRPKSWNSWR